MSYFVSFSRLITSVERERESELSITRLYGVSTRGSSYTCGCFGKAVLFYYGTLCVFHITILNNLPNGFRADL